MFILNDLEVFRKYKMIKAEQILDLLLKNSIWVYNNSTPNIKNINMGDKVLLYLAGERRRKFVGSMEIAGEITPIKFRGNTEEEQDLYSLFSLYSPIQNVNEFDDPIYIKEILDDLDFIKNKYKYGMYLRHSIKAISESDFETVIQYNKEKRVSKQ